MQCSNPSKLARISGVVNTANAPSPSLSVGTTHDIFFHRLHRGHDGRGQRLDWIRGVDNGLGWELSLMLPDVTPASAAAHEADLDEEGEYGKGRCNPHERVHGGANLGANVDGCVLFKDVAHDDEHNGPYNGRGDNDNTVEECEHSHGEGYPATGAGLDWRTLDAWVEVRNLIGLTGGSCKQLVEYNADRIKVVEALGLGAVCDAVIVVALAEIPQADLVKIVQTQRSGDAVEEGRIGPERCRNDIGEVKADEPDVAEPGDVVRVTDFDDNEEDDCDEEASGGNDAPHAACVGCTSDIGRDVGVIAQRAIRLFASGSLFRIASMLAASEGRQSIDVIEHAHTTRGKAAGDRDLSLKALTGRPDSKQKVMRQILP
ncbi:hypothetical protein FH972_025582 [Carpinus fangiana]|uniref:Uncharacterized protein n=1 Tax=Carpinus fangiana TaxID=176857 RepID=A0A5N6L1U0_9ROSI|nr:hypothetical protein FH972_025582 [Carpinus fangiana]